ncbi:MAG: LytR C-terminal domain-containing protein [Gemmatimonadota bacterium]|nr:LytR C-terminal domain-containing protein [Gemmatimonadota bacterium]
MGRFLRAAILGLVALGVVLLLGSSVMQWIPVETAPRGPVFSPAHDAQGVRITVDVRNAGGVDGMARTATDYLRGAGFDVVGLGNARTFDQETSVVIDRVGNRGAAARVADVLGIDSVASDLDPNLFVDVTVRLGAAWTIPREPEPVTVITEPERVGLMERLRGFLAGKRDEG